MYCAFFYVVNDRNEELDIDGIVKIVGYEMKYSPCDIAGLFLDANDYNGLFYWYDFIMSIQPKPQDK